MSPATPLKADPVTLANELRPVLLQIARQLRQEVHPLGVTGGQVSLLASIRQESGIGLRELATREGVSPAAMCRHIDRLEAAELVRRVPERDGDRRRIGLEVTAEGERVLRLVRSRRTAWLASKLKQLESEQLDTLEAAVEPLAALLRESG
jgi:DNA-binding MarR family transcriptional regulator